MREFDVGPKMMNDKALTGAALLALATIAGQYSTSPIFILPALAFALCLASYAALPIGVLVGVGPQESGAAFVGTEAVLVIAQCLSDWARKCLAALVTSKAMNAPLPTPIAGASVGRGGNITGASTVAAVSRILAKVGGDYFKRCTAMFTGTWNTLAFVGTVASVGTETAAGMVANEGGVAVGAITGKRHFVSFQQGHSAKEMGRRC
jgi:hypothetical protein